MALEITRCFGGELKTEALRMHMTRNVKPNVKLILDALARGEDPIHVTLLENVRSATQPGKGRHLPKFQRALCTLSFSLNLAVVFQIRGSC